MKQLLDVAVVQPIDFDVQYVDYGYFDENYEGIEGVAGLGADELIYGSPVAEPCWQVAGGEHCPCEEVDGVIICKNSLDNTAYESQGIEFGRYSLDDIDIFEFAPTYEGELEDFVFRFARQNRPGYVG